MFPLDFFSCDGTLNSSMNRKTFFGFRPRTSLDFCSPDPFGFLSFLGWNVLAQGSQEEDTRISGSAGKCLYARRERSFFPALDFWIETLILICRGTTILAGTGTDPSRDLLVWDYHIFSQEFLKGFFCSFFLDARLGAILIFSGFCRTPWTDF